MTQRAARHAATALLLALAGLLVVLVTAGLARAATFTVNSTCDTGDASPDGTCNDGAGNCCLREAIDEVNGGSGGDTIARSGTLVIPPPSSELPVITQSVTIDFTPSSVGGLPGGAAPTTAPRASPSHGTVGARSPQRCAPPVSHGVRCGATET